MKVAPLAEVKARFSAYVKAAETGPVIVTRNGKPVAALISVTDEDELDRLILAHTPRFRALLAAAEERIVQTGGLTHDEFWRAIEEEEAPDSPKEL